MGNLVSDLFSGQPDLCSVPAQQLSDFVRNSLEPSEECQKVIKWTVDAICCILKRDQQQPLIQDVARGGSYGRKTVFRGKSDGTLVLFLSHFTQFQDQKKSQREILDQIEHRLKVQPLLKELADIVEIQRLRGALIIQVSTKWHSVSFEVVPAFNALGTRETPRPCIYRDLKRALDETKSSAGEFSVCFTELQQKFFNNRPRKLKDLILLVKYWYRQCQIKLKGSSSLPPYALELLTVYAWEQGCGAEDFDLAEGIRTVLRLICQYNQLCVYWTINYDFEDETVRNILLHQIRSPRPVILDPTDPTNNVGQDMICWPELKKEAQAWLSSSTLSEELPAPSWTVLPAPLSSTPGQLLDKFIKDFLQPDQHFLNEISTALDTICTFLQENCFQHSTTKIQKVVKGGSAAKGTALKTGSDADIIVFPNSFKSYTSQRAERSKVVEEIHTQLDACQQQKQFEVKFEISNRKAPWGLSFTLKSKMLNQSVDFDVMPAFNALGQCNSGSSPNPKVYADLIDLYKSQDVLGGEFHSCFTELQRNFIESRPPKLKDLIRLVKHWYTQCRRKVKTKSSLPPKYALELLTVYAWEKGSNSPDFDTAEGFRTVLELIINYQQLCIFWTVNYSLEDETMRKFLLSQIQKTRPVILDPAEPTSDLGGGDRWCWHLLAREAKKWLSSLCFNAGVGYSVEPWKVPEKVI